MERGLKLELKKWQFLKEETKYIGLLTNKKGVKSDLNKMEVVIFMLMPKSEKEVRGS